MCKWAEPSVSWREWVSCWITNLPRLLSGRKVTCQCDQKSSLMDKKFLVGIAISSNAWATVQSASLPSVFQNNSFIMLAKWLQHTLGDQPLRIFLKVSRGLLCVWMGGGRRGIAEGRQNCMNSNISISVYTTFPYIYLILTKLRVTLSVCCNTSVHVHCKFLRWPIIHCIK